MNVSLEQYHQMNKQNEPKFNRMHKRRRGFFGRKPNNNTQQPPQNQKDNRRRLVITDLSKEILNVDLRKLFEQFGTLIRCGIHFDKMGNSKGTADIEFDNHESAEKAIVKLNQADINGAKINVNYLIKKTHQKTRNALIKKRFRNNPNKQRPHLNPRNKRHSKTQIGGHVVRPRLSSRRKPNQSSISKPKRFKKAIRRSNH